MSYGAKTYPLTYVNGYAGSQKVGFVCELPAGKGKRSIAVEVPAETVKLIAAWLERCPDVGHAMYHFQNGDSLSKPCSTCAQVITENRAWQRELKRRAKKGITA